MAKARVQSDIDTDFEYLRKDDVIAAEANDYGYDCFAKIETFGTMLAKNVLKGCTKVSGIENHVAIGAKLANFITGNNSLKQEWEINPDLQSYVHSDPRLEKIWDISPSFIAGFKEVGVSLFIVGALATAIPLLAGLLMARYLFKFHPALSLGCTAGARTTTAALGAIQDAVESDTPALGYTVTYAVGNTLLIIWGVVIVLLM